MQELMTMKDVCKLLGIKPYRVEYQIRMGQMKEPARISGRRIWTKDDVANLKKALGEKR